ncbi:MAG: addiction module protein [Fimbriiglobus sp.]
MTGETDMGKAFAALGLDHLSDEEKLDLAGRLWDEAMDAVPEPPPPMLTNWQREELQRRLADAEANPDDWVSWEEVKASALRRLSK